MLAAALALALAGCAVQKPVEPANGEKDPGQPGSTPSPPEDEECQAYILLPDHWEQGVILEGSPEMGYLLLGFNVPAGTLLYAPFDGITGAVSLEGYSSNKSYKGRSLYAADSLNGFSAYNVAGTNEGPVSSGHVFAEVSSNEHIFPNHYGKVNLILEFNLFDSEAAGYAEMQALFEEIFDHLLEKRKGKS